MRMNEESVAARESGSGATTGEAWVRFVL